MGEGHMWSPETGWGDAKYVSSIYVTPFTQTETTRAKPQKQPLALYIILMASFKYFSN
jgi:hypothetical protein